MTEDTPSAPTRQPRQPSLATAHRQSLDSWRCGPSTAGQATHRMHHRLRQILRSHPRPSSARPLARVTPATQVATPAAPNPPKGPPPNCWSVLWGPQTPAGLQIDACRVDGRAAPHAVIGQTGARHAEVAPAAAQKFQGPARWIRSDPRNTPPLSHPSCIVPQ